jgi:hypothetical protein
MLVVAGVLASGCGGSKRASADANPAESRPVTKAQAVAFARAVNLRPTDLPGWRFAGRPEAQPLTDSRRTAFARCAGTTRFRYLARLPSTSFLQGSESAGAQTVSIVAVAPTPSLAASESDALATARGRSCFIRVSRAQKNEDIKLKSEHFFWFSLPLPAAAHAFKVRVAGTSGGGHIYFDQLTFTSGPAQITLFMLGFPSPPQPGIESHLISLLYSRANAGKL